ncbi:hypothetical protein [Endozoicomonas sp. OPT23]|uniref:hypothetical protein n=1 Tax=Endozoicomonas sp. OPT23 TaxID=2072845 RepID=UPI00129B4C88|nr:hypothetical protein [Endozoicomonas sp. OPT23]
MAEPQPFVQGSIVSPAGSPGTELIVPNRTIEPVVTLSPILYSYPSFLLKEARGSDSVIDFLMQPFVDTAIASILATIKKSGLVYGKYLFSNETYAAYIQAAVGLVGAYFGSAKMPVETTLEASIVESSIQSFAVLRDKGFQFHNTDSEPVPPSITDSILTALSPEKSINLIEDSANQVEGYGSLMKRYLPKLGLLGHAITTGKAIYTRTQEQMYALGFTGDRIQLLDDDGSTEEIADIYFVIPSGSKPSLFPFASHSDESGKESSFIPESFERRSLYQPHIEINPVVKEVSEESHDYGNSFIKALNNLTDVIPEHHSLYLFPEVDPQTARLTFVLGLLDLDRVGDKIDIKWLTIEGDWRDSTEYEWLTERLARRSLVEVRSKSIFYDYVWGDERNSLPILNPLSAEMLNNITAALEHYHNTGELNTLAAEDVSPAVVKQSGNYLAAVDSGEMVLYVDTFASQKTESPRMVMKRADIQDVDEDLLATLDSERIWRYSEVIMGEKPFDPARWQMERLLFRVLVGEAVGNYADAIARYTTGMEKIQYGDSFGGPLGSLMFFKDFSKRSQ